jgi:hypothetical protein
VLSALTITRIIVTHNRMQNIKVKHVRFIFKIQQILSHWKVIRYYSN